MNVITVLIKDYLRDLGLSCAEFEDTDSTLFKVWEGLMEQEKQIQELVEIVDPLILLTSPNPKLRAIGISRASAKRREDSKCEM